MACAYERSGGKVVESRPPTFKLENGGELPDEDELEAVVLFLRSWRRHLIAAQSVVEATKEETLT